ncbi:MAG: hypothetical protein Q9164_003460 [Protoblastenia rupestris]
MTTIKESSRDRFPELYVPASSYTNPYARTRDVPMRVLCLGMPRYVSSKLEIRSGYTAVCDIPAIMFSKELIEAYPDAKVILTLRNIDSWHDSMMKSIVPISRAPILNVLETFDPSLFRRFNPMWRAVWSAFCQEQEFKDVGKRVFVEQHETVRRLVPEGRLLEYQVGEGWARLCDFLEIPVPDFKFPVTNESAAFRDRFNVLVGLAIRRSVLRILPILGAVVAIGAGVLTYSRSLGRT